MKVKGMQIFLLAFAVKNKWANVREPTKTNIQTVIFCAYNENMYSFDFPLFYYYFISFFVFVFC